MNHEELRKVRRIFLQNPDGSYELVDLSMFLHAPSLPDDDEPITAEWTESPLCTATGREDVWLRIYDDCFEMMVKGNGWNVLRLPAVRTRGDVRQLVKLLGRE